MLSNNPNERMEFQDRPTTPVVTGMLIVCLVLLYSMAHGLVNHGMRPEDWLSNNVYNLPRVMPLLDKKDIGSLFLLGFNTEFSTFNMIQMALNMYFFWVFGKHVEGKLGAARYFFLIFLGIYLPLVPLHLQMAATKNDTVFVGSLFLLCTIIGTYMVFPPMPKSKMGQGETSKQNQGIFRKGGRADPLDKYIANPWMFVATFAVMQVGFHFWITLPTKWFFFEGMPGFDTFSPIPCLVGFVIGWLIGQALLAQATAGLQVSPMTLQAVKRYHELLELDVKPEEALRGTARTLGVPYDKVKEWVKKNKGSMRIK